MIVFGIILALIGFLLGFGILLTIGVILIVVGAVLWIAGAAGHAIGPRSHYW